MKNFNNIQKKDGEIYFTVRDGVTTKRKITLKNGMVVISFQNKKFFYFEQFQMSYGTTVRLIEITPEMKEMEKNISFSWSGAEELFEELVKKYSYLERENTYVPSAPDSSRFMSTKSGFIRVLAKGENFGSSHYSSGKYIHKGIQIGGNVINHNELIDTVIYLGSLFNDKLRYSNSETKPRFQFSLGTNYSTYGIG